MDSYSSINLKSSELLFSYRMLGGTGNRGNLQAYIIYLRYNKKLVANDINKKMKLRT